MIVHKGCGMPIVVTELRRFLRSGTWYASFDSAIIGSISSCPIHGTGVEMVEGHGAVAPRIVFEPAPRFRSIASIDRAVSAGTL